MSPTRRAVIGGGAAALASHKAIAAIGRGVSVPGIAPAATQIFTRTVNADTVNPVPATAFWMMGVPLAKAAVPSGNIISLKRASNGSTVRSSAMSFRYEADGSTAWCMMLFDLSGHSVPAGTTADLQGFSGAGSWGATNSRTTTDWINLADTAEITNLVASASSGTTGMDSPAGTWTATFDGTSTSRLIGSCALGSLWEVQATPKNGATSHTFLRVIMYYLVYETAGGALGPIASLGPFVDNTRAFAGSGSTPGITKFKYDLNFKRGGASQRSHAKVSHGALSYASFRRLDARWDWSANDPQIWINVPASADPSGDTYAQAGKTKKIARFLTGITYSQSNANGTLPSTPITGVNTTTGVFTVASTASIQPGNLTVGLAPNDWPVAVQFTGANLPTGISLNTIYWLAKSNGSTTFNLYADFDNAAANTNPVIPSTTGTIGNFSIQICAAPITHGILNFSQGAGGATDRPDVGLYTEWDAAYHVANTKTMQDMARIMATASDALCFCVTEDSTNKIPGLLPTVAEQANAGVYVTPTSMLHSGSSRYTSHWLPGGSYSSDINGGSAPVGGANGFGYELNHTTNPIWGVWLMEGDPFMAKILMQLGNRAIGTYPFTSNRNINFLNGASGNNHFGLAIVNSDGLNTRGDDWGLRDLVRGWFAAEDDTGTPAEKTYLKSLVASNMAMGKAYDIWRDNGTSTYSVLGLRTVGETDNSLDNPNGTNRTARRQFCGFMMNYRASVVAESVFLMGDFVSDLVYNADFALQYLVNLFTDAAMCGFYTPIYCGILSHDDHLSVTGPGTTLSTVHSLPFTGGSPDIIWTFTAGSANLQMTGANPPWTVAIGDKIVFQNYGAVDGTDLNSAPSPFSDGVEYTITSVNNGTRVYTVNTGSGANIVCGGAGQVSVGSGMLPAGQSCPAAPGVFQSDADPDGYLANMIAGLAINSIRNPTFSTSNGSISTAYTTAKGRYTGFAAAGFAAHSHWAFSPTL